MFVEYILFGWLILKNLAFLQIDMYKANACVSAIWNEEPKDDIILQKWSKKLMKSRQT